MESKSRFPDPANVLCVNVLYFRDWPFPRSALSVADAILFKAYEASENVQFSDRDLSELQLVRALILVKEGLIIAELKELSESVCVVDIGLFGLDVFVRYGTQILIRVNRSDLMRNKGYFGSHHSELGIVYFEEFDEVV